MQDKNRDILTIAAPVQAEIIEKKSRFIGYAAPVESEEAAQTFLQEIRTKHRDATHNCYAYQVGEHNQYQRSSDDGEPSGTAGRPILEVIKGSGLANIIVVVTRYFGGTLLGTGGLVRAYSATAAAALAQAEAVRLIAAAEFSLTVEYQNWQRLESWLTANAYPVQDVRFTDKVDVRFMTPIGDAVDLAVRLSELFNAEVAPMLLDDSAVMRRSLEE